MNKGSVKLLEDRTATEFNIALGTISDQQRVYVECTRCHEIFIRQYGLIRQLHDCPKYKSLADGTQLRFCTKCNHFKPTNQFNHYYCKQCNKSTKRIPFRTKARRKSLLSWIQQLNRFKQSSCASKNIEYNLNDQYLLDLWKQQHGRCYYFGVKLVAGSKTLQSAWIDRLDDAGGYMKGNVVWASKAAIKMKSDTTYAEFINMLMTVDYDRTVPVRLECKRIHPDAKLPTRSKITDAAYDIYTPHDATVPARGVGIIQTGIALTAPYGYYYTIEGRSSLWKFDLMPHTGIIDATYSGELLITMANGSATDYNIKVGDRIAQVILHRMLPMDIVEVDNISYAGRGAAGFGSTGR